MTRKERMAQEGAQQNNVLAEAGIAIFVLLLVVLLLAELPVGAGVTLLFLVGMLINNLSRNRQYPLRWF